ncbi:hypothetical protein DYBT9275_05158 [Dyadobacter sp. CECT 9275]|uniref:Uncharacterized protein n=1 Tax=Dyadobacter helix TaxID=2822344 RepID=A0A916JJU5_9BACT|nr:hypothetical protein DYBT9275_05158 [Dyadobacter sp. CECT 9275]
MRDKPLHEKITDLSSVLMALTYAGGGIYLIFSSLSFRFMPVGSVPRYALAGILILYGFYRGYRVWKNRA